MKWIIIFLIVSCGKHESPPALDLRDSDGDQILNYLEGDFGRYVADVQEIGLLKGVVRTSLNEEIPFSNFLDLKTSAIELMLGQKSLASEDFFSEWSRLRLELTRPSLARSRVETIHLQFETSSQVFDELLLVNGDVSSSKGPWSSYMRLEIPAEEYDALMAGSAYFAVKKQFPHEKFFAGASDVTIREKTHRIYVAKEEKADVMYVSKELKKEELLRHLGIPAATVLNDDSLFFDMAEMSEDKWFMRTDDNGNIAFIRSNLQALKTQFLSRFKKQSAILNRINGKTGKELQLSNPVDSVVYLKVRPSGFMNVFQDRSEFRKITAGSKLGDFDEWRCWFYFRDIVAQPEFLPGIDDFTDSLRVNGQKEGELKWVEQRDERGPYWEVKFYAREANVKLTLPQRPSDTFVLTGQYDAKCERNMPARGSAPSALTNSEGLMSFEVDSYVEKIR